MTPDNEEMLRLKLRHLRTAHHHLLLAAVNGWLEEERIQEAAAEVAKLVHAVSTALERLREL